MSPTAPLRRLVRKFRAARWAKEQERALELQRQEEELQRQLLEWQRAERLQALQASTGLLLDIGTSTARLADDWIALDLNPGDNSLRLDASKPWPLPDGCARAVRAEHMIEHLSWEEAKVCINEMARVLEPGGVCRICTPDLEGISRAYLERDPRLLEAHREDGYSAPTWSHMPNNYLRMWGHAFVFDFDSLRHLLEAAGFGEIERAGFNRSRHELLDGADSHDMGPVLAEIVVCVDAVKAGER